MKWDSRQYWLKSRMYQARAIEVSRDQSERAFWRSLALEHLMRAALTSVHPALNADPRDEGKHLLHAFGFDTPGEPKSLPAQAVTSRLERIVPDFQKPHRQLCDYMMLRRNDEVHSCASPYEGMREAEWLPHYYEVCDVLNRFVGESLESYFGEQEAEAGHQLSVRQSAKRGEVEKRVAKHRDDFGAKDEDERTRLIAAQHAAATAWASPSTSQPCPACGADALAVGSLVATSEPVFREGIFVEEQRYLTAALTCGACDFHLGDIEEIYWGGVAPQYSLIVQTDLHELLADDFGGYMNM
jgi:hypothetical protein